MSIIESDRMTARRMSINDVENLLGIFSDPIAMRYYPGIKNVKETKDWINWNLLSYDRHGFGLWAWILKEANQFAGQCGLIFQKDVEGKDEVEIGYLFLREYWNRGLATEAATACKNYGFKHFGYKRLICLIDPNNKAARRVAEKIGMKEERKIQRWNKDICLYAVEVHSTKKVLMRIA